MGYNIGIIGAATGGVSMLGNLLRTASTNVDSVTLIDPLPPGRGPVFNAGHPFMLCNTSAGIGSLIAEDPDDFLDYLADRGEPTTADTFVPRDVVGEYVRARYWEYVDLAAALGIKATYHPAQAISVQRRDPGRYQVRLDDGTPQEFDRVIICVGAATPRVPEGFAPYTDHPLLIMSPYPATELRQRITRRGCRLLVLGTGPSAIDAAVSLCHDGHNVTMASRSGRLPAVRTRTLDPPVAMPSLARIAALDPADPLIHRKLARIVVEAVRAVRPIPLRRQLSRHDTDPVRRLREDARILEAGRCSWQDIVVSVISHLDNWSSGLPTAVRNALLTPHRPAMWRYLTSMPLPNAKRLLHHIDAGRLRVAAYDPSQVTADNAGFDVSIRGGGRQRFDYAVNAIGAHPPTLHADARTVYLSNPPSTATVLDNLDRDLRVRLGSDTAPEHIWLVGQSTHIQTPYANSLLLTVAQAGKVAHQLSHRPALTSST